MTYDPKSTRPATKGDLQDAEKRLDARIDHWTKRIADGVNDDAAKLEARIHALESANTARAEMLADSLGYYSGHKNTVPGNPPSGGSGATALPPQPGAAPLCLVDVEAAARDVVDFLAKDGDSDWVRQCLTNHAASLIHRRTFSIDREAMASAITAELARQANTNGAQAQQDHREGRDAPKPGTVDDRPAGAVGQANEAQSGAQAISRRPAAHEVCVNTSNPEDVHECDDEDCQRCFHLAPLKAQASALAHGRVAQRTEHRCSNSDGEGSIPSAPATHPAREFTEEQLEAASITAPICLARNKHEAAAAIAKIAHLFAKPEPAVTEAMREAIECAVEFMGSLDPDCEHGGEDAHADAVVALKDAESELAQLAAKTHALVEVGEWKRLLALDIDPRTMAAVPPLFYIKMEDQRDAANRERDEARTLTQGIQMGADSLRAERDALQSQLAEAQRKLDAAGKVTDEANIRAVVAAHRSCNSEEHDPSQGRVHGYCMVCGVPWPCAYALEARRLLAPHTVS